MKASQISPKTSPAKPANSSKPPVTRAMAVAQVEAARKQMEQISSGPKMQGN